MTTTTKKRKPKKPHGRPPAPALVHLPIPSAGPGALGVAARQRLGCAYAHGCSDGAEVTTRSMRADRKSYETSHYCAAHWTELYAGGPKYVDPRAPHRALRNLVDVAGRDFTRDLYASFNEYNAAHFAGALKPPMLLCTQTSSPRALGDYNREDNHGLQSVIRLSPKAIAGGPLFARDVLLHEMVHAWQYEIAKDTEDGYRGHGPVFARQCNEIGAALGLAEVSAKARGGKPDCAAWPINVRPAGYYGDGHPAAEAERRKRDANAKRERAEKEPADDDGDSKRRRVLAEVSALCEQAARDLEKEHARDMPRQVAARVQSLIDAGAHFAALAQGDDGDHAELVAPAAAAE